MSDYLKAYNRYLDWWLNPFDTLDERVRMIRLNYKSEEYIMGVIDSYHDLNTTDKTSNQKQQSQPLIWLVSLIPRLVRLSNVYLDSVNLNQGYG